MNGQNKGPEKGTRIVSRRLTQSSRIRWFSKVPENIRVRKELARNWKRKTVGIRKRDCKLFVQPI
jgi:hypothetical protein